jgi:PAS domain S-box-containing protein
MTHLERKLKKLGEPTMIQPNMLVSRPARILAVDDDERNLLALSEVLEDIAEVVTASSGEEALRFLLKEEFAVILLDVLMPGLDGYETANLLRQRQQSRRTPIIFLTAVNKEDGHLLRGYDSGAVDYVFKPFEPLILRSKVSVFVDLFEKSEAIQHKARTEQRLLEENVRVLEALRQAEQRQEAILRSLPVCFHSRDIAPPFGARFVSDAVERLTGFPPERLTGEAEFGLSRVHPDDLKRVVEALSGAAKHGSYAAEYRWRCADGAYRIFLDQGVISKNAEGEPAEIFGTLLDVTEQRNLQDQLLQSQKLDAIGKLTGGIAHDFNNLLASILSGLGLIERRTEMTEETERILQMTRHAAKQGALLINRMLAFSRRQPLEPEVVQLEGLADNIDGLVRPILGGLIRLEWDIGTELAPALVDAGQLELSVINLVLNSRDAMPSGGTVTISLENREQPPGNPELAEGTYVVLSVKDTGAGIAPDDLPRIIEPFFTTKELGKGTGLGLSTVFGFSKQSGGTVRIESKLGKGTVVELWLPQAPQGAAPVKAPAPRKVEVSTARTDRRSVLLVEDSDSLRQLTAAQLADSGFEVTSAAGGAEALALLEREPDRFDVIVTDFAMPLINGLEVIHFARNLRAGWPAVLVTGYAEMHVVADRPQDVPLLTKPFVHSDLVGAIGSVTS